VLLAVDVGNTQTHLGVFDRAELRHEWRASTEPTRTADELALLFGEFLSLVDLSFSRQITGVAISSVVPRATQELRDMTLRYFGFPAVVVEPGTKTGLAVLYDNPREVGADRIANGVAAHAMWPEDPVIVIDFGSALVFDVITADGAFAGGAIAPGIDTSLTALFQSTAQLRRVELVTPESVIGKSTVTNIQSGLMYGTAALVDGLIERMTKEVGADARTVATGGFAPTVIENCHRVEHFEPTLTLTGLRLIYERNAAGLGEGDGR
jgi:type III pantothenate kinase